MKWKMSALIVSLLYIPWSMYLYYLVLKHIGATELMWFMFWLLIPIAVLVAIISKIAEWGN